MFFGNQTQESSFKPNRRPDQVTSIHLTTNHDAGRRLQLSADRQRPDGPGSWPSLEYGDWSMEGGWFFWCLHVTCVLRICGAGTVMVSEYLG